jgi:hypothetical protein
MLIGPPEVKKKKHLTRGCRKIQQEQKNRKMYVLSELLLLLLLLHKME